MKTEKMRVAPIRRNMFKGETIDFGEIKMVLTENASIGSEWLTVRLKSENE